MRPNKHNMRNRDSSRSTSQMLGMIRRAIVDSTAEVLWRILGFEGLGDEEQEVDDAELFDNVGYHARPPAAGRPEVIRVNVGGNPNNVVIIGSRDRETLKAVLSALNGSDVLGEDETLVHNSQCVVHLRSDGTIEAKTPGGSAVALATADHEHKPGTLTSPGGPITGQTSKPVPPISDLTAPAVTSVLKGE